jgi:hypothetical protein
LLLLIEQIGEIRHQGQILEMARPIDAQTTLEVVSASKNLLEDDSSGFALSDYDRHFFSCRRVYYEETV